MQILLTGGAGYIGSHTVKHLLDNGYEVVVADNLIYGHREAVDKRAKFVLADLMDEKSLAELFNGNKIEAVIHFAAFAYHKTTWPESLSPHSPTNHICSNYQRHMTFQCL